MEKYKKEVFDLNMDEDFVRFMSDEDEARLLRNTFIEKGFEQRNFDIAKNLLKENISIDIISKTTGLKIEQINNLH